jgi:hypothetical protein
LGQLIDRALDLIVPLSLQLGKVVAELKRAKM